MKKPDRLIGYLEYEETYFPFEFDQETFTLLLFPPSIEEWNRTSSPRNMMQDFSCDYKKHEWLKKYRISGYTSEKNKIIFEVTDNRVNWRGFYKFPVNWYFYYSDELNPDEIDGFKVKGDEVDYFFAPGQLLKPDIELSDNGKAIKQMSIAAKGNVVKPCGRYQISTDVEATMEVSAFSTMHTNSWTNVLEVTSAFTTIFSCPVNLDILLDSFKNVRCFFMYATYRANITIHTAEAFRVDDKGLRDYKGLLVYKQIYQAEELKDAKDRVIKYGRLGEKVGELFTCIQKDMFEYEHLCRSLKDTHIYVTNRTILILTAFEREYRNIYGKDSGRSPEYIQVKKDIMDIIKKYLEESHGKQREYAGEFLRAVKKRDNSFSTNVYNALVDCQEIMKYFLEQHYYGTYEETAKSIGARIGGVRNGIAHSRLDLRLDATHLADIKIVEELIYAMRLRKIGIQSTEIQKAIKELFGE